MGTQASVAHWVATRSPKDSHPKYKSTPEGRCLRIISLPPTFASSQPTSPSNRSLKRPTSSQWLSTTHSQSSTTTTSPGSRTITSTATSSALTSRAGICQTSLAQASHTRGLMSWGTSTITRTSPARPPPQYPYTRLTGCPLTKVSQIAHPINYHSKTHISITGYHSPFYQGTTPPPFPQQQTAVPPPTSIHPAFAAPSPVPTLSYGRKCLPAADKTPVTHLS